MDKLDRELDDIWDNVPPARDAVERARAEKKNGPAGFAGVDAARQDIGKVDTRPGAAGRLNDAINKWYTGLP